MLPLRCTLPTSLHPVSCSLPSSLTGTGITRLNRLGSTSVFCLLHRCDPFDPFNSERNVTPALDQIAALLGDLTCAPKERRCPITDGAYAFELLNLRGPSGRLVETCPAGDPDGAAHRIVRSRQRQAHSRCPEYPKNYLHRDGTAYRSGRSRKQWPGRSASGTSTCRAYCVSAASCSAIKSPSMAEIRLLGIMYEQGASLDRVEQR
ncbi:hypothetical protein HMPREF1531_00020 [Propionibacterium sp. oral taxon 192 str. F0372]|nr:hypothetical protein HMPREF1531_00020 [Propionibacterium sp. oral taxon 192 str. F0372]